MLATFAISNRPHYVFGPVIDNLLVGFVLAAVIGVVIGILWAAAKREKNRRKP